MLSAALLGFCSADLTAKRRERVRADSRAQELRSDLRRGLSRLAGPLPDEVLGPLNANKEEEAFQAALTHLQAVSTVPASVLDALVCRSTVITFFHRNELGSQF